MSDYQHSIERHYGSGDLSRRILSALRSVGKDPETVTREDLAVFDEFHTGGRESTRALARIAEVRPGMRVLDVGSGVGGPARTLAAEFGATVVGLDLTEESCPVAAMLTDLVHLSDRVSFRHGDALAMPFDDARFDVVWSQNTLMNIEDKGRLFGEMHRVLVPGRTLAFESVLAGPVSGVHYPTFWASSADINFLTTPDETRALLHAAGFVEEVWEDATETAAARARARRAKPPERGLGREVIVAGDVARKIENSVRNGEEGRVIHVRAVLRAGKEARLVLARASS
jgi:MPBQ/MSBQ methyltransferase